MRKLFELESDRVLLIFSRGSNKARQTLKSEQDVSGSLIIRKRRADLKWDKIWRNLAGVPMDESITVGPLLFEETPYRLYARAKWGNQVGISHRDPIIIADLDYAENGKSVYGLINFRSQVGKSLFTVEIDGKPEFDFEVEVFPTKLDYRSDYEQMLAEVQEIMTALAMEYLRSTYQLGTSLGYSTSGDLEWTILLENVLNDLEQAVIYISRQPIRGLRRENLYRRTEQVKKVDKEVLRAFRCLAGKGDMVEFENGIKVRQVIPGMHTSHTLDTTEHRWIAQQLKRIQRRLHNIYRQELSIWNQDPRYQSIRRRKTLNHIKDFQKRISVLRKLEPFANAEGIAPNAFGSMRLLGAPGYKEAYRACLILNLGLRIEGGPFKLSLKDLNVLYEYWCYLAILEIIAEETGQSIPVEKIVRVKNNGLQILLEQGRATSVLFEGEGERKITVSYNPQFGGSDMLVPQKPDLLISLEEDGWPRVHLVLDAKYRLEASERYRKHYASIGPPEDAINIMHRYRDAILERPNKQSDLPQRTVVQAAALFPRPFEESAFFDQSKLWQALRSIGVGALPFLPENTDWTRKWMHGCLERGGFTTAQNTIPYNIHERAYEWRLAASEIVLLAVLRGDDPRKHLEWIKEQRLYYMPLTKTQKRQMDTRWIAFYSPSILRKPGAITHIAAVERIEILARKHIDTPWAARRNTDELQVLYKLGVVKELERVAENLDEREKGKSFRSHRWTSRLGLERAHHIRELLLETEPEWRLLEDLRALGIKFELEPGRAKLIDPENPQGRTEFVFIDGSKTRYAGASGYYYQDAGGNNRYFLKYQELLEMIKGSFLS